MEGTIIPKVWKTAVAMAVLTFFMCTIYEPLHDKEKVRGAFARPPRATPAPRSTASP